MSIKLANYSEVINAINYHYDNRFRFINNKMIKKFNGIESNDRSKTQFYRYALKNLQKQGYLKEKKNRYKILKRITTIDIEVEVKKEVSVDICEYCGNICNGKIKHINIAINEKHIFCSPDCKENWIFRRQKKNDKKKR